MSRKVRLCAIIVFIIALIISIIRILIDFNYGIERISPLIPVLDIASAIDIEPILLVLQKSTNT